MVWMFGIGEDEDWWLGLVRKGFGLILWLKINGLVICMG
jgi:hypothetical protein